ncbi:MAG: hypothetical protein Kow0040_32290 [Thermogutta sp.]
MSSKDISLEFPQGAVPSVKIVNCSPVLPRTRFGIGRASEDASTASLAETLASQPPETHAVPLKIPD